MTGWEVKAGKLSAPCARTTTFNNWKHSDIQPALLGMPSNPNWNCLNIFLIESILHYPKSPTTEITNSACVLNLTGSLSWIFKFYFNNIYFNVCFCYCCLFVFSTMTGAASFFGKVALKKKKKKKLAPASQPNLGCIGTTQGCLNCS